MSAIMTAMLQELEQETVATRRLLEAIPADRLDWRPHDRSMSLGDLGYHIANLLRTLSGILDAGGVDFTAVDRTPPVVESKDQIMREFDEALVEAKRVLSGFDDARAMSTWTLSQGEETLMEIPHTGVARAFLLNHLYHHRGQLSVYLRMLDIPVPSVYGPTADENPFAG